MPNSAIARNTAGKNGVSMVVSACFEEEVSYMFCTVRFYRSESIDFSFSTVAPVCTILFSFFLFYELSSLTDLFSSSNFSSSKQVLRKRMTEIPDASLAYMDGLQHTLGIEFGQPKYV